MNTQKDIMMKTKHILLFSLLLLFAAGPLSAQKIYKITPAKMQFAQAVPTKLANSETALPTGLWYKTYLKEYENYLVYKPAQKNRMQWGDYLDFSAKGGFSKGYNARCGNDSNIHHHTGKASIEGQILILDLGVEGIHQYKIVIFTDEMLALAEIE